MRRPLDTRTTLHNKAALVVQQEKEAEVEGPASKEVLLCVHSEDIGHPTRDWPETKQTKDCMARANPANNQRAITQTYHPQQYPHPHYQHEHHTTPTSVELQPCFSQATMPAAPRNISSATPTASTDKPTTPPATLRHQTRKKNWPTHC
jgi:hypothetical protein